MTEFKLGYKHYPKDLRKFGYANKAWDLSHLRFGNDTLIELGRTPSQIDRTLNLLLGLIGSFGCIFCMSFSFQTLMIETIESKFKWSIVLFSCAVIVLTYLSIVFFFQYFAKSVIWPAEYPVRFNRKTGKVYVYEPQLSKHYYYFPIREIIRLYKPIIKVYDWQDIEGMVSRRGYTFIQVIFAAVIDRKSDTIIDHFTLWDNANSFNKEEWRWLLSYMDGMEGMNYKGKLYGRFWVGRLFNFFAPEFNWPEGIDKASRAESMAELVIIEQQYDLAGKHYPCE